MRSLKEVMSEPTDPTGPVLAPLPGVVVTEPTTPDRVRRPVDLLRLVVVAVVLVVVIVLADVAVGTTGALEQDLSLATDGTSPILLQVVGWLAGLAVVVLPVVIGTDLLLRRRPLQLVEALAAAGVGALIVIGLRTLILDGHLGSVLGALTRPLSAGRTSPLDAVAVSLVAMLTVADIVGRRWVSPLAVVVIGSSALTTFVSGQSTSLAVFVSLLLGWLVGLAFRYGVGAVSTRPSGSQIAAALVLAGVPLTHLELVEVGDAAERQYVATTGTGDLAVRVMDRDTFGFASGRRLLRMLRLRGASTRAPALNLRAELEHRALMSLTLADAGIPAPRVVAVTEVGPFSACIAYSVPRGRTLQEVADAVTDRDLAAVWRLLGTLRSRRVAHRGLGPDIVMLPETDPEMSGRAPVLGDAGPG
ncbi:MAG: hypothetical protein M3Y71_04230, partial [Actinomycetota bacterium]|nr:hypothetical protein [Actinomycetota bacterium]